MNLFLQGMRRSGTTIIFDILSQDDRLDCFYEPFAAGDKTRPGGGSGVQDQDLFEKIRRLRREFASLDPDLPDDFDFNLGAPRHPHLEYEPDMPEPHRRFLRFLLDRSEHSFVKVTRMSHKAAALHEVAPDAGFLHVVRDPRCVVTSYLWGRGQVSRAKLADPDAFFGRTSQRNSFGSWKLFRALLDRGEHADLEGCPDYLRFMLLWKATFRPTYEAGRRAFGDRYRLVRNEDLIRAPRETLRTIYDMAGLDVPPHLPAWCEQHLRTSTNVFEPGDPRWEQALRRLDLDDDLRCAGYSAQPVP